MPLHSATVTLDRYELATILAALRLLQNASSVDPEIKAIASDCNDFEPLNAEQIDGLCAAINLAPQGIIDPEGETYSVAQHKLAAIRARVNGNCQHPALAHYGDMTNNTNADVLVILNT